MSYPSEFHAFTFPSDSDRTPPLLLPHSEDTYNALVASLTSLTFRVKPVGSMWAVVDPLTRRALALCSTQLEAQTLATGPAVSL